MSNWNDWRWQLENCITTVDQLRQYINLTDREQLEVELASAHFNWCIPPYFARLMDRDDRNCPIRRQVVPSIEELEDDIGVPDPLEEGKHSPVELVIRVYPDRVAFTVSNRCATYCRHCLRKERGVGRDDVQFSWEKIQEGIDYIRDHEEVRDVLLTGGDPLLLPDETVERILSSLRAIPSVEVLRIGSRVPCTLPQRITPELCEMLQKYHPLYLNTQFNHPREITAEAEEACDRLLRAGIPLGNQSVLLRGINDEVAVMKKLVQELMRIRVRPYYLYQCQILKGTRHLRTPIECGTEIIRNLQGYTSGLAVPKFVLDTPYGKIPLGPTYLIGRDEDEVVMRSFDGRIWREPNPLTACRAQQPTQTCNLCQGCCLHN